MKNNILPFLSLFLLLAAFVAPGGRALANSADVKIALVAAPEFPGAKGVAKLRDRKGEREFQVEAQVSPRLAGTVLHVSVDGNEVGQMTITAFGAGRLNLNSKLGQNVPAVGAGSVVEVVTGDGTLVLIGKF